MRLKSNYLLPLIVGVLTLLLFMLPWRFQVNDDVIMMWLVSGAYTGTPESYALFIHPMLSYCLSILYTWIPEFNWYGFVWILTNGIATYLIAWSILKSSITKAQKFLCLIFLLLTFIHLSIFLQFTLVAGFAAFASLQLFFLNKRQSKTIHLLAVLCFFVSVLIRWESVFLVSLGTLWTYSVFIGFRNFPWKKTMTFLVLFASLIVLKFNYEKHYLEEGFLTFNKLRSEVRDHPVFADRINEGEISQNSDWYFFSRWMFEELPIFSSELRLKKTELDSELIDAKQAFRGIKRIFQVQSTEIFKSALIFILLILFLMLDVSFKKKLVYLIPWILFYLLFNHFYLLMGRVNFLFSLVIFLPIINNPINKAGKVILIPLQLIMLLFLGIHFSNFYREAKGRKVIQEEIEGVLSHKKQGIPIFIEGVFEYFFDHSYSYKNPVPVLTYGWISRSPFQHKAYQRMGFERQVDLKEYGVISFDSPELLIFPVYMGRISRPFSLKEELRLGNMRLTYFETQTQKK